MVCRIPLSLISEFGKNLLPFSNIVKEVYGVSGYKRRTKFLVFTGYHPLSFLQGWIVENLTNRLFVHTSRLFLLQQGSQPPYYHQYLFHFMYASFFFMLSMPLSPPPCFGGMISFHTFPPLFCPACYHVFVKQKIINNKGVISTFYYHIPENHYSPYNFYFYNKTTTTTQDYKYT